MFTTTTTTTTTVTTFTTTMYNMGQSKAYMLRQSVSFCLFVILSACLFQSVRLSVSFRLYFNLSASVCRPLSLSMQGLFIISLVFNVTVSCAYIAKLYYMTESYFISFFCHACSITSLGVLLVPYSKF